MLSDKGKKQKARRASEEVEYSMRAVTQETGLTADVIRVWEKRYGAVTPGRTVTGRRYYSGEEVERLKLLRSATLQGHAIGRIAQLPLEQLRGLASSSVEAGELEKKAFNQFFADNHLEQCLTAMEELDAAGLENVLARSVVHFGPIRMMEEVLEPLLEQMDRMWESGRLRIAEEHVASAVMRTFLSSLMRHAPLPPQAPVLAIATPSGQLHELGALMAAVTAAQEGWKILYLGPNLPAREFAAAALRSKARVVALSIVYPSDDTGLPEELYVLRQQLPDTPILAGGRAAEAYEAALGQIDARRQQDLRGLRRELAALRPR